ncbi:hypothetical protein PanWU01x14_259970 [Parasponia andersonii]|uniref:Uncharacterized protein n=1 Tax=Parasponia andersonii TaxID=3476 RepID=A0A2P5B915_PARAD|nr:hypothetical protein PanWU01x14_259970 [Parasponia andersonii]
MEKTRERKVVGGFMKALYTVASKPNSGERCGSKVNPSPILANGSFSSQQYWMTSLSAGHEPIGLPDHFCDVYGVNECRESRDNGVGGGDENVDVKVASYISYMLETLDDIRIANKSNRNSKLFILN